MPKKKAEEQPKEKKTRVTKKGSSNAMKGRPRVMTPAILANPGGRPSEFDQAAPKIIALIRKGNTYECASGCARVTYHSFNNWMKQGEKDLKQGKCDSKFFKFFNDVKQAETDAENEVLQHWKDCIPGNWQAAKEFLARRNPDSWAARDRMDITSNGETVGKPVFLPLKKQENE